MLGMAPCVLHEDDAVLVVHKPAGWPMHAPSPWTGEGLLEWLRHREPRWASLAAADQLDKEASGLLVFSKSPVVNRILTEQFARRTVRKRYVLVTDLPVRSDLLVAESYLVCQGNKYVSQSHAPATQRARTEFRVLTRQPNCTLVEAVPSTGHTHQVRVHAADLGFPILGDTLYGGTAAPRLFLRADALSFQHPTTGQEVNFQALDDFDLDPRLQLRWSVVDLQGTTAFRLIHGASDGWPGWYVDRLGDWLLSQSEAPLQPDQLQWLQQWLKQPATKSAAAGPQLTVASAIVGPVQGVYHKPLRRDLQLTTPQEACPQLILGQPAPERFVVLENGLQFELSFREGYSVGLFLDQRDNRRRLLTRYIAAGFPLLDSFQPSGSSTPAGPGQASSRPWQAQGNPTQRPCPQSKWTLLNTFAYTCGFSVCAAKAGARVTSIDLSRKYLQWGRRNFELNGLDPGQHQFLQGDVLDWLRRLARKGQVFDVVIVDPPTFSRSKAHGVFRAEKDYGRLVEAALQVLKPQGVLLAATNAAAIQPPAFVAMVKAAARAAGRRITALHYAPQPPDFPISRAEPAHLKTVWLRV